MDSEYLMRFQNGNSPLVSLNFSGATWTSQMLKCRTWLKTKKKKGKKDKKKKERISQITTTCHMHGKTPLSLSGEIWAEACCLWWNWWNVHFLWEVRIVVNGIQLKRNNNIYKKLFKLERCCTDYKQLLDEVFVISRVMMSR